MGVHNGIKRGLLGVTCAVLLGCPLQTGYAKELYSAVGTEQISSEEAISNLNAYISGALYQEMDTNSVTYTLLKAEDAEKVFNYYSFKGDKTFASSENYLRGIFSKSSGWTVKKYDFANGLGGVSLEYMYGDTLEERMETSKKIDTIYQELVEKNTFTSVNQVVTAVNNYIVDNYMYTLKPEKDYNPYNLTDFIKSNQGVCQAYVALSSELLSRFGVEHELLFGYVDSITSGNNFHVWLGVELGDEWYHVDVTWNDAGVMRNPYLFVPNQVFTEGSNKRTFTTDKPYATSYNIPSIPYDISTAGDIYNKSKLRDYTADFWALNKKNWDGTITFRLRDYNESENYKLNVYSTGDVYIIINGVSVRINGVSPEDAQRIIENNGSLYKTGDIYLTEYVVTSQIFSL